MALLTWLDGSAQRYWLPAWLGLAALAACAVSAFLRDLGRIRAPRRFLSNCIGTGTSPIARSTA